MSRKRTALETTETVNVSTLNEPLEPVSACVPVCRVCDCWHGDACVDPLSPSGTCYWVEGDLCSVCFREQIISLVEANFIRALIGVIRRQRPRMEAMDLLRFMEQEAQTQVLMTLAFSVVMGQHIHIDGFSTQLDALVIG